MDSASPGARTSTAHCLPESGDKVPCFSVHNVSLAHLTRSGFLPSLGNVSPRPLSHSCRLPAGRRATPGCAPPSCCPPLPLPPPDFLFAPAPGLPSGESHLYYCTTVPQGWNLRPPQASCLWCSGHIVGAQQMLSDRHSNNRAGVSPDTSP